MLLFLIHCKTIKNERIEGIFYRYKNKRKSLFLPLVLV